MSNLACGIDLGTSTSIVSYLQNEKPITIIDPQTKSPIVPSVVALNRHGKLVVGQTALDQGLPQHIIREAKRAMGTDTIFKLGDHELRPEQVGGLVLKMMRENAEIALGRKVDKAVITVPAYFEDLPRLATERAAQFAGIEPLRLISEPVAAAIAYGLEKPENEGTLLVYDFGGGTLDVTLIEMMGGVLEVITTDGDKHLGGKDMDELLMNWVVDKAGFARPSEGSKSYEALKKGAEQAKVALSSTPSADIYIPNFQDDSGKTGDIDVQISRKEFDALIQPLVDRSTHIVEACLKRRGIAASTIQKLLLVGGTSYVPAVRETMEKLLGRKPEVGLDPNVAVSLGAAYSAGLKLGSVDESRSILVQDKATHRMGIQALVDDGGLPRPIFSELMPKDVSVPFFKIEEYQLLRLDQDEVEIRVYEDLSGKAVSIEDAERTSATGVIEDIPASTTGEPRKLLVEFRCNENHRMEVKAKIVGTDREMVLRLDPSDLTIPIEIAGKDLNKLWEESPLAGKSVALIRRAEQHIADGHPKGEIIEATVLDLKNAIAENRQDQVQSLRSKLVDLLSELES